MMEFKTIGKSRLYEMASETSSNLLIRFIIHFLFVEHDSHYLDLFDKTSSMFNKFD